jgi:hypothetical protein
MSITSTPFKYGYVDERGYTFIGYHSKDGYPIFLSPAAFHRNRVFQAFTHARKRSEKKGVPFDITVEYLLSIFPEDGLCPVFGVSLVWKTGKGKGSAPNSPSLDRIIPAKGYTIGNLVWVSTLANSIKQNATSDQILAVGKYYAAITDKAREDG